MGLAAAGSAAGPEVGSDAGAMPPTDLAGVWSFLSGESALGLDGAAVSGVDFDDSSWDRIEVPSPFTRRAADKGGAQRSWFRTSVVLGDVDAERWPLGIAMGRVNSAYEIWVGGELLGGVGKLPADPRSATGGEVDYDKRVVWPVPAHVIGPRGEVAIALLVWTDPGLGAIGGPHEGPYLVGRLEQLGRAQLAREVPDTVLVVLFLFLALFHLELYRRRREQSGYLWFAIVAVEVAVYSFLRTQWKYHLLPGLSFGLLKETEHVVAFLLLPSFVHLIWHLLELERHPLVRVGQATSVSLALIAIVVPGLSINHILIRIWEVLIVAHIVYGLVLIARERRKAAARTISIGITLGSIAFVHDIAVDIGLLDSPRLIVYGFTIFVLALSATLGVTFAENLRQAERLRQREIELKSRQEVAARSNEAKIEFLANMSHEIRTPMTAILGGLDLLDKAELSEANHELLGVI